MLIPPSSPSTTTMDGRDVPDDKKSLLQLLQQVQQQMHQQQQEQDLHNLQALLSASTSSSSVAGGGHRAPAPAAPVPSAATSSSGITSSTLQSLQQLQGLASLLNGGAGTSSADLNSLSNPNPTNPVAQQQITPQALPMFGEGGRRSTGFNLSDALLGLNTTSSNSGSNNDNTTTTNLLSRGGFNQHQLSSSLGSDSSASATGSSFLAAALSAAGLTAPSTTLSAATGADVYAMAGPSGFQPPAQPLRNQPNSSTAEAVLHQHQLNLQRQLSRFGGNSSNDNGTIVPCRARGISKDHNKKTAYFVIPENMKHGADLLCSHIQCQNKGIRFVYCVVCDEPVAKINFRTRHSHLDVLGPSSSSTAAATGKPRQQSEGGVPSSLVASQKQNASDTMMNPELHRQQQQALLLGQLQGHGRRTTSPSNQLKLPAEDFPSSGILSGLSFVKDVGGAHPSLVPQEGKILARGGGTRLATMSMGGNGSSITASSDQSGGDSIESRSKKRRLNNADAKVAAASNKETGATLTTPGGSDNDAATTTASAHSGSSSNGELEQQWMAMLKERPTTKKPKRIKAWIDRLLSISEGAAPLDNGDEDDSDEN